MDRARWKAVNEIFHAALEVSLRDRPEFIEAATEGDADLKAELELLLKADLVAGSFIDAPFQPENLNIDAIPRLRPGEILCGRFKIVRAVAEGGMGQVFEAIDSELGVQVALKLIRGEIGSDPEAMDRFRQEVRLARRITHPNVCRTFDIERETRPLGSADGSTHELIFLTMEFLEGETLAERIHRDGALPLKEALAIARQVASALDAAHVLGVVHRDLKPSNIMLVPTERGALSAVRAVLTDFGLARLAPMVSSENRDLSHSARPIGTLAYMAPEQLLSAPVSPATDVYAFGLILFEMVTGQRAFPSDSFLSGIAQRLSGPAPDPRSFVPSLPEPWYEAITGCLQREITDRYAMAAQTIQVLEGGQNQRKTSSWPTTIPKLSPRILIMLAVAVLLVVSLSVIGSRLFKQQARATLAPGALVYLAPVQNRTGDRNLDNLTELLHASLGQSAQINLLDSSRIGDTLQQMTKSSDTPITEPIAREIAMRTGAVRVVFAEAIGSQGKYRLDVEVQQPDNTPARYRDHWRKSFAWQSAQSGSSSTIPQDLLVAVRNASDWIRNEVGESANDIARLNIPPEDVTTENWQAVEDYSQAELLARNNQTEAAVSALKSAVDNDPQFALAWGRMGDLLLALGKDMDGFKAYDKALDLGQQSRLTRREEDRIRGMRAVDAADDQLAVDAFHDYSLNYAADPAGWTYPLGPLHRLKRDAEAISDLQRAIALEPGDPFAMFGMANELILLGRRQEALQWDTRLRSSFPELADRIDRVLAMINGEFDRANEFAQRATFSSDPERRSYGFVEQASLAGDRGNWTGALSVLNRGIEDDVVQNNSPQRAWKLLDRSYVRLQLGDFQGCLDDVHNALSASSSPWLIPMADTVLGTALAEAPPRYVNTIRKEITGIKRRLVFSSDNGAIFEFGILRTEGELLLDRGRIKDAVAVFRRAELKDAPAGGKEYLARALVAQAKHESNPAHANKLLTEALQAYSDSALNPALIWCQPSNYLPGFYGNQLESYLKLADRLHIASADVIRARDRFRFLRPYAATESIRKQTEIAVTN